MSETPVRATLTAQPTREQREYEAAENVVLRLLEAGNTEGLIEALVAAKRKRKRAPRIVENPEYAQMIARLARAMVRRIGETGDVESLADFVAAQKAFEQALADAVAKLREGEQPYSWADIGRVLSMTRQAAAEKYTQRAEGQPKRVRNRGRIPATVTPIRQETG